MTLQGMTVRYRMAGCNEVQIVIKSQYKQHGVVLGETCKHLMRIKRESEHGRPSNRNLSLLWDVGSRCVVMRSTPMKLLSYQVIVQI